LAEYLNYFEEVLAEGRSEIFAECREYGFSKLFGPLVEVGFVIPPAPEFDDDCEDDESPLKVPNEEREFYYDIINEFSLWCQNFIDSLVIIDSMNQIYFDDYGNIYCSCNDYIWWQLLDRYIDMDNVFNKKLFASINMVKLREKAMEFERYVTTAWYNSYNKNTPYISDEDNICPPTWTVPDLLCESYNDMSSFEHNSLHDLSMREESPDPFIRKISSQVRETTEMLADVHEKLDIIMTHFQLKHPAVGRWANPLWEKK